jgi:predicted metal-dependent phosphoesterase TrpH
LNSGFKSGKRWLKAEMHAHCNLDPKDYGICRYTPEQLIQKSAEQGFEILAITCHDADIWTDKLSSYARSLGVTLIPGMEVTAEKTRHVLVYNFDKGAADLSTLEKIRLHSGKETLVVAPHPFFPGRSCLRKHLEHNTDLFDAIEYSGFTVSGLNFNLRSIEIAQKTGKPLLGSGDIHHLWQLGKTYTWIYAEAEVFSILEAIRFGNLRMETSLLSWMQAAGWWADRFKRAFFPANRPPEPSDKIKDRGRFGTPQKSVESQGIHVGQ